MGAAADGAKSTHLDAAVDGATASKYRNNGQTCVAIHGAVLPMLRRGTYSSLSPFQLGPIASGAGELSDIVR
ncbi:hypothetical protein WT27_24170 [Burkholderia territorii]|uniref:Aldehyde dehydrogenase family protein n=1 Tax=Burkholderia territorii TaxID=1503055 RepID=A0A119DHK2_9BURK|nr:hypothetical protein WT27_24170 [Burkholderia territorii]KVX29799.1 hypothetical protein WT31_11940 [Burkholderia territorii]